MNFVSVKRIEISIRNNIIRYDENCAAEHGEMEMKKITLYTILYIY